MKLFFPAILSFALLLLGPKISVAHAAMTFGNGTYTNLCGTGTAATADTCNKGCNPATGSCTSDKPYVIKWTCNGNMQECRMNESGFATTQNIGNTTCDQTVSIQVYSRNCRTYFGWICNEANLLDSMLWYSGSCGSSPTPTMQSSSSVTTSTTASPVAACEELAITSGNNSAIPASVSFHIKANGSAYTMHFGDGTSQESVSTDVSHTYQVSGSFVAKAEVKDVSGNWQSSVRCEIPVSVKPSALETQKSDCSDVFIIDGNNTMAPTTMSVRVTGYDNKGTIQKYRLSSSDGQTLENTSGAFQISFAKAGTYTVSGSIVDSTGAVKSGSASCAKTVSVVTEALTSQPDTGTPTLFSILALASGILGVTLLVALPPKAPLKRAKSPVRTKSKRKH